MYICNTHINVSAAVLRKVELGRHLLLRYICYIFVSVKVTCIKQI